MKYLLSGLNILEFIPLHERERERERKEQEKVSKRLPCLLWGRFSQQGYHCRAVSPNTWKAHHSSENFTWNHTGYFYNVYNVGSRGACLNCQEKQAVCMIQDRVNCQRSWHGCVSKPDSPSLLSCSHIWFLHPPTINTPLAGKVSRNSVFQIVLTHIQSNTHRHTPSWPVLSRVVCSNLLSVGWETGLIVYGNGYLTAPLKEWGPTLVDCTYLRHLSLFTQQVNG